MYNFSSLFFSQLWPGRIKLFLKKGYTCIKYTKQLAIIFLIVLKNARVVSNSTRYTWREITDDWKVKCKEKEKNQRKWKKFWFQIRNVCIVYMYYTHTIYIEKETRKYHKKCLCVFLYIYFVVDGVLYVCVESFI